MRKSDSTGAPSARPSPAAFAVAHGRAAVPRRYPPGRAYHDSTHRRRRHRRADAGAQPASDRRCRQVFESVSELKPLGVGINVLPHAVRELTELGLLDELDAAGVRDRELAYYSKHGQPIWSEPRGLEAGYQWPQFSIHRGALQKILLDAASERLGRENILTGHHLTRLDRNRRRRAGRLHRQATGKPAGSRRRVADRRRRHPLRASAKALSAGRAADLERPHPLARHHRERRLPVRPHHDHGRSRDPEVRLLSDLEEADATGIQINWIAERHLPPTTSGGARTRTAPASSTSSCPGSRAGGSTGSTCPA